MEFEMARSKNSIDPRLSTEFLEQWAARIATAPRVKSGPMKGTWKLKNAYLYDDINAELKARREAKETSK